MSDLVIMTWNNSGLQQLKTILMHRLTKTVKLKTSVYLFNVQLSSFGESMQISPYFYYCS